MTPDIRKQRLAAAVYAQMTAAPSFQVTRWVARIESQSEYDAVIVIGRPVNHILHLLLSCVTFGLWLIVWLLAGLFGGERRVMISVNPDGDVNIARVS
jgi:hypothetical protein